MEHRKASFVCCSYRRTEFLCELLYCFLAQDWDGGKELVILQDEAEQTLYCDHPDVRIVNWPRRITPLGLKRNMAMSIASGRYLFHVDDDDLYLPSKISSSILNSSPGGVFKTDLILVDSDSLELVSGCLPSNYMFTKDSLIRAAGYELDCNFGGDPRLMAITDSWMVSMGDKCHAISEPTYVYRWHGHNDHCCTMGMERAFKRIDEIPHGRVELTPKAPSLDIFNATYVNKGRSLVNALGMFQKKDLATFYKGIEGRKE